MAPDERSSDSVAKNDHSRSRRQFLRAALAFSVVMIAGGIAAVTKSLLSPEAPPPTPTASGGGTTSTTTGTATATTLSFPKLRVANMSDLTSGKPIFFNYPLEETPNVLVKLGAKAENGIGPDSDVVAFSALCQHLGCVWGFVDTGKSPACDSYYKADSPVGYCCCHGSIFDLEKSGEVIDGPAPRPQPQVILELDDSTGDIFAMGMTPPSIFGHNTGSNDVLNDLKGGTPVS